MGIISLHIDIGGKYKKSSLFKYCLEAAQLWAPGPTDFSSDIELMANSTGTLA